MNDASSASDEDWIRVVRSEQVIEGQTRLARVGVRPVAVTRQRGRVYVYNDRCPHAGSPLHVGRLTPGGIECGRHRWVFDLDSGVCREHPLYKLRSYDTREADGWILVLPLEEEIW